MPQSPAVPRRLPLLLAVLAAAGSLTACYGGHINEKRQTLVETRPLNAEGTFRLQNVNGRIEISTWQQDRVKIEAEKAGSRWALEHTQIEISGEGDQVTVETRQPKQWLFGGSGRVDYHVTVPERARIEVETTNGRVRIEGAQGPVRAATVNGGVEVEDAVAAVEATTTNGAVRLTFRRAPVDGSSRVATTNGSVTLLLPQDATGSFEASTVNGGIQTDFPLKVSGGFGGHRLSGRVGEGKARFDVRTVNGGVRIRRQGEES
jgi:putative adhesin